MLKLGSAFYVPGDRGPRVLGLAMRRLVNAAAPYADRLIENADQLEKAYEALFGHRYGELAWWEEVLAAQIEMAAVGAYEREHDRVEIDRRVRNQKRGMPQTAATRPPAKIQLRGDIGKSPQPPPGAFQPVAPGTEGAAVLKYLQWMPMGAAPQSQRTSGNCPES